MEPDHLGRVRADIVLVDILRVAAIGRVGLDVNAIGAVVKMKIVDKTGAHEGIEGRSYLAERNSHGLCFLTIDGDEKLRVVGGKGGVHAGKSGTWRTGLADKGVGNAIDIAEGVAAGVLQDELETTNSANAGHRRR